MSKYCVRAGYWYEYTGIGRDEDENLTTNEVCNDLNNLQKQLDEVTNLLHKEIKTSKNAFYGLKMLYYIAIKNIQISIFIIKTFI